MKKYILILIGLVMLIQACNDHGSEGQINALTEETEVSARTYEWSDAPNVGAGTYTVAFKGGKTNGDVNNVYHSSDEVVSKQPDKIIKTGRISIEVDDYTASLVAIKQLISTNKGYVASENEQRNDYRVSNTIVVRVLNDHFDQLMEGIASKAGKLNYKNVDLRDVTEEYTDLAARMKTKKEVEQRYLEILKTARTVKDILEVEDKLRYIREEIESTEARLKYLDDKVQYSTITLEMSQELDYNPPAPMQVSFFDKLGKAVKGGWNGLLGGMLALVNAWPLVLLLVLVAALIRRWIRKRKA